MIRQGQRLHKLSEYAFAETDQPKDRSKPLEWQQHFTPIHFPLTRVRIISSCRVHDTEYVFDEKEQPDDPLELVTPNISSNVSLWGLADPEQTRDSIACLTKDKNENDIYFADYPRGAIQISIRSGEPAKGKDRVPDGVYYGTAFRYDVEPNDDHIHIELNIPTEHIHHLVSALRSDENSRLEVTVDLLGFTYEVDDALREHYHPRTILMHEVTPCFAINLGVSSNVGDHSPSEFLDTPFFDEDNEEDSSEEDEIATEERKHHELIHMFLSLSKQLNGIVAALWIIAIIIGIFVVASIFQE